MFSERFFNGEHEIKMKGSSEDSSSLPMTPVPIVPSRRDRSKSSGNLHGRRWSGSPNRSARSSSTSGTDVDTRTEQTESQSPQYQGHSKRSGPKDKLETSAGAVTESNRGCPKRSK